MRMIWAALLAAASATVLGCPMAAAQDDDPVVFEEQGKASFYGAELKGRKTASGARFDPNALTAAHPTLPLGSSVTVINPGNGKEVEVEVNDRGPGADDRSIDLSRRAASQLGITRAGVAEVRIEATKQQVEQAIDVPADLRTVQRQLDLARRAAAADGTPQPRRVALEPPDSP